jgi:hypothetical protein
MQIREHRERPNGAKPLCVAETFVGQQRLFVLANDPPAQLVVVLTVRRMKSLGEHDDRRAGSLDAKSQDRREHPADGAQRLDVNDGCAEIAVRSGDEACGDFRDPNLRRGDIEGRHSPRHAAG